jgi:hypothetical protein
MDTMKAELLLEELEDRGRGIKHGIKDRLNLPHIIRHSN